MSDLIDRQAVLDAIDDYTEDANRNYEYDREHGLLQAREILIKAPQYAQECGDAISRERAIKEMAFSDGIRTDDNILYVPLKDVNKHLQNLPSVQPELFGNSEQLDGEYDPRQDIYYLAEKIGIHRLYSLVVQLRGEPESCIDTIGRQAAIDALNEYFARIGKLKRRGLTKGEKAISLDTVGAIKTLPSAQPEIKPIEYRDCANAMLRMWIDNVVTDGEYNRIMDRLNAYWGMENE